MAKTDSDADLLHSQVAVFKFQKMTTEELIAIWEKNDQRQWTNQDFEVIKNILRDRIGQVPEQQIITPNNIPQDTKNTENADKTFFTVVIVILVILICPGLCISLAVR